MAQSVTLTPPEANTDRPGGDFFRFEAPVDDAGLCGGACEENNNCRAWTYVKPGRQGPRGVCYLKNSVPASAPSDCCVSGLRNGVIATPAVSGVSADVLRRIDYASTPARGVVPTALVLFDFGADSTVNPARAALPQRFTLDGASVSAADYFNTLVFGRASARASDPEGRQSVSSLYWGASKHTLLLAPLRTIGPISVSGGTTWNLAAQAVGVALGSQLPLFDKNRDGRLDSTELAIVVIDNGTRSGAATRDPGVDANGNPYGCAPAGSVQICGSVAAAGYLSRLVNVAHEFAHVFGRAYDTYGVYSTARNDIPCWGGAAYTPPGAPDTLMSLMGCTIVDATPDDWDIGVDFDAFHRLAFGWTSPQVLEIGRSGTFRLKPTQSLDERPLVLITRDRSEAYFVELRRRSKGGHDAGVNGDGLVFWYSRLGARGPVSEFTGISCPTRGCKIASALTGDDVPHDSDGNGLPDIIRGGANGIVDSTPVAPDGMSSTYSLFPVQPEFEPVRTVGGGPRDVLRINRFATAPTPIPATGIRLRNWADQLLPFRIDASPAPDGSGDVIVFVTPP